MSFFTKKSNIKRAQNLECQPKNIANWFTYRRKLLKFKMTTEFSEARLPEPIIKKEIKENDIPIVHAPQSQINLSNSQDYFPRNPPKPMMNACILHSINSFSNYNIMYNNYIAQNLWRGAQMQIFLNNMKAFQLQNCSQ